MAGTPANPDRPIRVLVVDDSAVVRMVVSSVVASDPRMEVVGTASNGELAVDAVGRLNPDVVTLDVEMPVMSGLEALQHIRRQYPTLPVIMFSTLTDAGATATLQALSLGANDFATKPSGSTTREQVEKSVRETLVPLLHAWGGKDRTRSGTARHPGRLPAAPTGIATAPTRPEGPALGAGVTPRPTRFARRPHGIVIGSSTGGPPALTTLLSSLPARLGVPILVVQHMPPVFTRQLASRLDSLSQLTVVEAADQMPVQPDTVYVAPGGSHLILDGTVQRPVLRLSDAPPENSVKPAVDVTLRSVERVWGAGTLVVILTGMGADGLAGTGPLHAKGARVIAQDEVSSAVWGMPGAVTRAGLTHRVEPLDNIARAVVEEVAPHGVWGVGA